MDSNAYTLTPGSFSVFFFHFSESRIFMTPSHKWHHKQTKIMFQITKFTLSDRIYPIKWTYIRIADILWHRQNLRAVKVRAIWWGKGRCSFIGRKMKRWDSFQCYIQYTNSWYIIRLECNAAEKVIRSRINHKIFCHLYELVCWGLQSSTRYGAEAEPYCSGTMRSRSEQLSGPHANEIKHNYSPVVVVV